MKKIFYAIVLSVFICGCASPGYYHFKADDLGKSDISRFDDIPVPMGFKFFPLNSFVYEAGKVRIGVLEYYGSSFPYKIVKFYKDNMPNLGWRILNVIESKDTLLSFEKDNEICIVKFSYKGSGGSLVISISPRYEEKTTVKTLPVKK
ncbi:MAG: hypothetical protein PHS93_07155 [Candidatus Omnitrophica bacterium]|nr:hypothetical protein [Candidatus Omnitrophota bacterium]MDD5352919.1 hypothetical protein [Candidatus Omnitrophota bacterium]MDD5550518.1 hypothetical protein [Candidatus Omnitrophota bacterium]